MRNLLLILFATFSLPAHAVLNIFACEPEWAMLAAELGGDKVKTFSATGGLQDPHRIEARPSLIARARNADLLVCTGAELETGWLPLLLGQSGNAKIQAGQPAHFMAADYVTKLDMPAQLDRAEGDVHPAGNPHIQTDPRNILAVADALAQRLRRIDAANAAFYDARHADFAARWRDAMSRWEKQAAPLKGMPIVVQHKSWAYLSHWLGLREVAALEPRPGIEPSSAHLQEVLARLEREPARFIIRAAYNNERPSEWLAQRAHIPAVMLPFTVGGTPQATDLFALFDDTLRRLLDAAHEH
ncbi:MAG: zinc ABC transporter substrate-binding protein [Pseudomonadota bacterium]